MRVFIYFVLLCTVLTARDNPFVPMDKTLKMGFATNKQSPIKEFDSKTIELPTTARVIKSVSVTFQNLDGTTQSIQSEIDKKIDWHTPLILMQNKKSHESSSSKKPKNLQKSSKKYDITDFVKIEVAKNDIKIYAKDSMIRDFMLTDPYKIVVDFKADRNFYTKKIDISFENVKKFVLGNHGSYYRAVVELDGQYAYKLDKKDGFIHITLQ